MKVLWVKDLKVIHDIPTAYSLRLTTKYAWYEFRWPTVFALTRDERVEKIIMDFLVSRQVAQSRIINTEANNTGARIMEY